jgi:hypothetical protein
MIRRSSTPDVLQTSLSIYQIINSKVPFHENLPSLPSHRSGVPERQPRTTVGLYSAGNYRTGHLPRRGLVDFTSSQISPITL